MATNPVNLVDAVSTVASRYNRTRSAVVRVGTVTAVGTTGTATVTVAGGTLNVRYHVDAKPAVGDVVTLLNDRDIWVIIGTQSRGSVNDVAVPCVIAHRTTTSAAFASGVLAAQAYNVRDEDAWGMSNAAGDTFTIPRAGLWDVKAVVTWSSDATGVRIAQFIRTGVEAFRVNSAPTSGYQFSHLIASTARYAVGDTIAIQVSHSATSSLTLTGTYKAPFSATWLGP